MRDSLRRAVLDDAINIDDSLDSFTTRQGCQDGSGILLRDANSRNIVTFRPRWWTESTCKEFAWNVVVYY